MPATDAVILALVETGQLAPKPTAMLRSAIARQVRGEPVRDLLHIGRAELVSAMRARGVPLADPDMAAVERAIRAELEG